MARVVRRKLAVYAAEQLMAGRDGVLDELAALLRAERREREIDLLVRDIETELAARGVVVAAVESARALTAETKGQITRLLSAHSAADSGTHPPEAGRKSRTPQVLLKESINPALIGGFRLRTPTATLDATVLKKLHDLRAKKIEEEK